MARVRYIKIELGISGQKSLQYFCCYFGKSMTSFIRSDYIWPLTSWKDTLYYVPKETLNWVLKNAKHSDVLTLLSVTLLNFDFRGVLKSKTFRQKSTYCKETCCILWRNLIPGPQNVPEVCFQSHFSLSKTNIFLGPPLTRKSLTRFPLTRFLAYVRVSGGISVSRGPQYSPTNTSFMQHGFFQVPKNA